MSQDPIAALRATLTFDQQTRFDAQFAKQKKKTGTATVLSLPLLGTFGLEQFYLGNVGSGIVRLIFFWTLVPTFSSLFEAVNGSIREQVAHANLRVATKIWKQVGAGTSTPTTGAITPAAVADAAALADAASAATPAVLESVTIAAVTTPEGDSAVIVQEQVVTLEPDATESLLVSTIITESIPDEAAFTRSDVELAADAQSLIGVPPEDEGILILEADPSLDGTDATAFLVQSVETEPQTTGAVADVVPEQGYQESAPGQAEAAPPLNPQLQHEVSTLLPDTATEASSTEAAALSETHLDVSLLNETPSGIPASAEPAPAQSTLSDPGTSPPNGGGTNVPGGGIGSGGDSGTASGGLGAPTLNPPEEPGAGRSPGEPIRE